MRICFTFTCVLVFYVIIAYVSETSVRHTCLRVPREHKNERCEKHSKVRVPTVRAGIAVGSMILS